MLYDIDTLTDAVEIRENRKLEAVKSMKMTRDAFILSCETDDEELFEDLRKMADKMQRTLDYCREVTEKRTGFKISQKKVVLRRSPLS